MISFNNAPDDKLLINKQNIPQFSSSPLDNHLTELTDEALKNYCDFDKINTLLQKIFELGKGKEDLALIKKTIEDIEQAIYLAVSYKDSHSTLLYNLIEKKCFKAAKQLVGIGISTIHSKNDCSHSTPLHKACYLGNFELVEALITHGAEVNVLDGKDSEGNTPLGKCIEALSFGDFFNYLKVDTYLKIVDLLLAHRADPKIGLINKAPIFNQCIRLGLEEWAWKLINYSDLNASDEVLNACPIHLSIVKGMNKLSLELLKRKVNVNSLCHEGLFSSRKISPLHIAVIKNNQVMVDELMKAGADPNKKAENPLYGLNVTRELSGPEPLTPYMMAVDYDRAECIDSILKNMAGKELDTNFPGTRQFLAGNFKDITRKGYSSIGLRLKTEAAKRAIKVEVHPFRCATADNDLVPIIQSVFNRNLAYGKKNSLASVEEIYRPLINMLLYSTKKDAEFSLFFLKEDDMRLGCYNADTGSELILSTDLRDEKTILPVLFHEMTHKSVDLIYPYSHCTLPKTSPFYEALKADLDYLKESNYQNCHGIIKLLLKTVDQYSEMQRAAEYLVRIPQAAILLAIRHPDRSKEEIYEVMKQSIPRLFAFFVTDFLPECRKWEESHSR